jgi:hypothetical protein
MRAPRQATAGRKRLARIQCPTCKRLGDWFAGPAGPFCSQRCKLIDLGKWLRAEIRLPEPLPPENLHAKTLERRGGPS